jgi:hypothetical protein
MLSDSCFDFLSALAQEKNAKDATSKLIEATYHYDHEPFDYGPEISILRDVAQSYLDNPTPSLRDRLLRTACLVMNYHDWMPSHMSEFAEFEANPKWQPAVVDMATLATWWCELCERTEKEEEPVET